MGSSGLSLRQIGIISTLIGGCVVFFAWLFRGNYTIIIHIIDQHMFLLTCIIGLIFFYLGFQRPHFIFHQCLLLLGCTTLTCAFLAPNIESGMNAVFMPLTIASLKTLGLTVLGFLTLVFFGFVKSKFVFKEVKRNVLSRF